MFKPIQVEPGLHHDLMLDKATFDLKSINLLLTMYRTSFFTVFNVRNDKELTNLVCRYIKLAKKTGQTSVSIGEDAFTCRMFAERIQPEDGNVICICGQAPADFKHKIVFLGSLIAEVLT